MVTLFSAETYDEINNKAWSEANGLGLIHRSIDPDKSLKTDTKYERILPEKSSQSIGDWGAFLFWSEGTLHVSFLKNL